MQSWIESANLTGSQFPIQNLPYGVFRSAAGQPHCCVAIGEEVLDLAVLEEARLIDLGAGKPVFDKPSLNAFMALGPAAWRRLRLRATDLLMEGGDPSLRGDESVRSRALYRQFGAELVLPVEVSGYTDFYACQHHAANAGAILRGDASLPPNWFSIPIGYNGRASTIVASGSDIRRPLGQTLPTGADLPVFGPTRRLDFELEIGAVIGVPSKMGQPVTVAEAEEMIFGYVLLNDWSARDIQDWEYRPLGPFQSKAFATSISPWIVCKDALEPFRVSTPERQRRLLPYLREPGPMLYDIRLDVVLESANDGSRTTVCRTNYREMYYSTPQLIAHHAVGGCKMNVGDLIGSGTVSGPALDSCGSLLELSWSGARPLRLENGETRSFLDDGDCVTLHGYASTRDYRIGFGECTGLILSSPPEPAW
jgi:fumarylacetoacetase